jgi:cyclopropane-fatty-acyl-phospholipid synthase
MLAKVMSDVRSTLRLAHPKARGVIALVAAAFVKRMLRSVETGAIKVTLPDGQVVSSGNRPTSELHVELNIDRWRAIWRLLIGGDVAFAKSYIDGDWQSRDLLSLMMFAVLNERAFPATGSFIPRSINRLQHWMHRNTRRGSRRNVAAHYDLGNAFYQSWLDRGMSYSSALFTRADLTLEEAQEIKLDRIVELLDVSPRDRVLEIGCGWGSLAERLARVSHVTGVTLSTEQLAFTKQRLQKAGLLSAANLQLQDYRDVHGCFDRVASIEMIEAVGAQYWPTYFDKLRNLLKPGGIAVLQAITIDQNRFANYRKQPDFIQRYIFPGGMVPTVEILQREAARAGFKIADCQTFGQSYARTLQVWRERFATSWLSIAAHGYDNQFQRMWLYYLCYCEAGFRAGWTDVVLIKMIRIAA